VRINIECAFGRLVARWAILRSAIPMNITIAKTTALVVALAKLHNFCDEDAFNILVNGALPLVHSFGANVPLPLELLGGGDHFDDMDRNQRKRRQCEDAAAGLPQTVLHALIEEKGLTRPAPIRDRH
jgi:hypothetical protein